MDGGIGAALHHQALCLGARRQGARVGAGPRAAGVDRAIGILRDDLANDALLGCPSIRDLD
jgi:hypothetical protein